MLHVGQLSQYSGQSTGCTIVRVGFNSCQARTAPIPAVRCTQPLKPNPAAAVSNVSMP